MKTRSRRRQTGVASQEKPTGRKGAAPKVARDWGAVIGEAITLALIVIVPVIINVRSDNRNDIKDATLGLGVAAALALWLLFGLRRGVLSWVASPVTPAAFAYFAWAGASVAYTRYHATAAGEFGRLAANLGLFFLALTYLRRFAQVRRLIVAACVAAIPVCIYGFLQAAAKTPAGSTGRVYSFLGNATYLASFLILILPLAVAAARSRRETRSRLELALFLATIPMMVVCFYFTFSFGPVIGVVLGLLLAAALWTKRGGRRAARGALVALGLMLVLVVPAGILVYRHMPTRQQARVESILHFRDPHGQERQLHWRVALALFREHPVTGLGYGVFRVEALPRLSAAWYAESPELTSKMLLTEYAHNEVLQALADTGLIGAALFLAMLALFFWAAVRVGLQAADPEWRRMGLALVVAVTAFVVQNQFGVTFHQTGAGTFYWLWLAVAAAGAASLEEGTPRLVTRRFQPSPTPAVLAAGAVLAGVFAVLVWVVVTPMRASIDVKLAKALAQQGQWQASAQAAEEAVALCPASAMGHYLAGSAWDALGDERKAVAHYEQSLRLQPGVAMIEYNAGYSYAKLGQLDRAEQHYRRAVALMSMVARHHASLADVLAREGKFPEAASEFRAAAACDPTQAGHELELAALAAQGQAPSGAEENYFPRVQQWLGKKDYAAAAALCKQWIAADPRAVDAYGTLGFCHFQLGQFAEAAQSFRQVLAVKPGDQQALYGLGVTCGRLGQPTEEREYLAQAVAGNPTSTFGREAAEALRRMGAGRS